MVSDRGALDYGRSLMQRRLLEKHLRDHGCRFDHHGGEHDVWTNPRTRTDATVPRHREIKRGTAIGICRQLGIPKITAR